MNRILFLSIAVIIMAGCTSRKDKKVLSDVDNNPKNEITQDKIQLPVDLIKLITDSLDGYSIPTKEDYDTKVNSFIESIPYPYFCKDDFDGNREIDYAFLLKSSDNRLSFFIFNNINDNFQIINMGSIPMGISEKGITTIISIKEKGNWFAFDTTIFVPNNGISLELLEESRTNSYYWDGSRYQRFFED